jgi:hypothetical protein
MGMQDEKAVEEGEANTLWSACLSLATSTRLTFSTGIRAKGRVRHHAAGCAMALLWEIGN